MNRFFLFAFALLLFPVMAVAESTCPSLVITGHPDYPPVAWAKNDAIVGVAPDLVTGIARSLGVTHVTSRNFGSWEKAQAAARSGEADIIFGIYKNDERMTYLDYLDPPFMLDPVSVVVRKGAAFPYTKWDDLKGKKGVTNAGESYGNQFDAFMKAELTVTRTNGVDKAFKALLDKQADYMIVGLYPGKDLARQLGIQSKIDFLPKELQSSEMFVALSKKSKCLEMLKAGFSAKLKTEVEQGKVKELIETATRTSGK